MKRILVAFLMVTLLCFINACGEIKIITPVKQQPLADSESSENARNAVQEKESQVASQEINAETWFQKAVDLWADGKNPDPKKIIEYLNEAIRLKPDYAMAYFGRGNAYIDLGQNRRALQDFDEAIRLKPNYMEAYYNRGTTYSNMGQHQRAIQDFDTAIRLKPNLAMAYYNRGDVYTDMGQHQRAIQDCDTAIRLKPDYALAYNNRGLAYGNMDQQQRAIQDYDTAIRLQPDLALAYRNRGIAYILSGNSSEGCRSLSKSCELGNCETYNVSKQKGDCR